MRPILSLFKKLLGKKKVKASQLHRAATITRKHHNISKTNVSANALKVLNRLHYKGYEAYLVGGGVRDLMLGQQPKDFDVATNATPEQVRKIFNNARLIGRRFRLAHILFHREVIEVATFRADNPKKNNDKLQENDRGMLVRDNVYGDLKSDVWRRDLTINALYYCPQNSTIIDYTGGVNDIKQKVIRIIGEPTGRFKEDPVRMIRVIRFAAKLGFVIEPKTAKAMQEQAQQITHVSNSRLFEEVLKVYHCGQAQAVQQYLIDYPLFEPLFPQTAKLLAINPKVTKLINNALINTDKRINEGKSVTPAFLFAVMLWFPMLDTSKTFSKDFPKLMALEKAMRHVLSLQSQITFIPKRFSEPIRQMWLLQDRFEKRFGKRPFRLLSHPRFRAAYDFLLIRAQAGDANPALAKWWTDFQFAQEAEQQLMIDALKQKPKNNRA